MKRNLKKDRQSRHLLNGEKNLIPSKVKKNPNFTIKDGEDGKLRINGDTILRSQVSRLHKGYKGTSDSLLQTGVERKDGSLVKKLPAKAKKTNKKKKAA